MTVSRRDFLRLRTSGRRRVAELSCERLYMRYVDALTRHTRAERADRTREASATRGEPPAALCEPSADELFEDLTRELVGADVVRVRGREWLVDEGFGARVQLLLADARRADVRVELG